MDNNKIFKEIDNITNSFSERLKYKNPEAVLYVEKWNSELKSLYKHFGLERLKRNPHKDSNIELFTYGHHFENFTLSYYFNITELIQVINSGNHIIPLSSEPLGDIRPYGSGAYYQYDPPKNIDIGKGKNIPIIAAPMPFLECPYIILDGNHRVAKAKKARYTSIDVYSMPPKIIHHSIIGEFEKAFYYIGMAMTYYFNC